MTASARGWRYDVEVADGSWIWLPGAERSLAGWAREVCADLYVDGTAAVELAEQLHVVAVAMRRRPPDLGALWVPDPAYGVLATLRADRYQLDSSLDQVAEEERRRIDPGLAPPEVDLVALPAGPALRTRRVERSGGPTGNLSVETVRHLVAPPQVSDAHGTPAAVELLMAWTLLDEGDEFADMADGTARLLRVRSS